MRRQRDPAALVFALELRIAAFELLAALQGTALLRRPGGKLASARPGREVCRRLGLRDASPRPPPAALLAEPLPVDDECGSRVFLQLARLTAFIARVEDKAVLVGAFQQHHACRRRSVRARRRERHGFGHLDAGLLGLTEPRPEALERIVAHLGTCT